MKNRKPKVEINDKMNYLQLYFGKCLPGYVPTCLPDCMLHTRTFMHVCVFFTKIAIVRVDAAVVSNDGSSCRRSGGICVTLLHGQLK